MILQLWQIAFILSLFLICFVLPLYLAWLLTKAYWRTGKGMRRGTDVGLVIQFLMMAFIGGNMTIAAMVYAGWLAIDARQLEDTANAWGWAFIYGWNGLTGILFLRPFQGVAGRLSRWLSGRTWRIKRWLARWIKR